MFQKKNIGVWLVLFATMLPVVVWFFSYPLSSRFGTFWTTLGTFGKAAAIAGFVLFALNFVLALRVSWLETLFGSLDHVYRIHHMVGGFAFIFLLFHPLLIALSFISLSGVFARDFLFSIGPWPVAFGKLALGLLFILLVLTFYAYKKLGHDRWKIIHKLIGVPLAFGVLHAFFVSGEVSQIGVVRYYLLGIGLAGLASYLWRTIFRAYRRNEYTYEFVRVMDLGGSVNEVVLKPIGKKLVYIPGQFGFIRITDSRYDTASHPFTISSSPTEDCIRFSIKALGDYTKSIASIEPGTLCRIEGPFGRFTYTAVSNKRQLWIAGGIGVTPFLSMARYLQSQGSTEGYDIDMYYSGKTAEDLVFIKELQKIAKVLENGFRMHPFDSSEDGYLTGEVIAKTIGDLNDRDMFLCGPPAMMDSLRAQFTVLGFPLARIHKEDFALR